MTVKYDFDINDRYCKINGCKQKKNCKHFAHLDKNYSHFILVKNHENEAEDHARTNHFGGEIEFRNKLELYLKNDKNSSLFYIKKN